MTQIDVQSENNVASKLASISWDFVGSATRNSLHSIHPYPAKFIPEIPRALISLFHPGDRSPVFDPFCGSGTTLVEAKNACLPAVGVDLSPLSSLISRVKTTELREDFELVARDVTGRGKERMGKNKASIPLIPNLDHWFKQDIQEALAVLVNEIECISDENSRNALKVALSSIIVRVSNQDSDTRYAAIEKGVTQEDVWTSFERAASHIARVCGSQSTLFPVEQDIRILNRDIMCVEPTEIGQNIGLVVTSPSYPNAYEYWLYHKYRMFWLGMDPLEVKAREIGARAHYFKKNHQTEHDFEAQMQRCFWLLSQVMSHHAYACFVVGRSIIHGREIDNEALLARAALRNGFHVMGSVGREISASRKSFNLHHANIKREGIVVFQLEGM